MPYFRVLVQGEGKLFFGFNSDGSPYAVSGFFTTCIIRSFSVDRAKDYAMLRIEKRWKSSGYFGTISGNLILDIEEAEQISAFRYYRAKVVNFLKLGGFIPTIPNAGHTFY